MQLVSRTCLLFPHTVKIIQSYTLFDSKYEKVVVIPFQPPGQKPALQQHMLNATNPNTREEVLVSKGGSETPSPDQAEKTIHFVHYDSGGLPLMHDLQICAIICLLFPSINRPSTKIPRPVWA